MLGTPNILWDPLGCMHIQRSYGPLFGVDLGPEDLDLGFGLWSLDISDPALESSHRGTYLSCVFHTRHFSLKCLCTPSFAHHNALTFPWLNCTTLMKWQHGGHYLLIFAKKKNHYFLFIYFHGSLNLETLSQDFNGIVSLCTLHPLDVRQLINSPIV